MVGFIILTAKILVKDVRKYKDYFTHKTELSMRGTYLTK
jgi:hypothetical protein